MLPADPGFKVTLYSKLPFSAGLMRYMLEGRPAITGCFEVFFDLGLIFGAVHVRKALCLGWGSGAWGGDFDHG